MMVSYGVLIIKFNPVKSRFCLQGRSGETWFSTNNGGTKENIVSSLGYQVSWTDPPLGEGAFGKVLNCILRNGARGAVKVGTQVGYDDSRRMFELLDNCHHFNIMVIHDIVMIDMNVYSFMELYPDGDLIELVIDNVAKGSIDIKVVKKLFADFMNGLKYLHGKRIVHRDVKPDNVMVCRTPLRAVLVDFDMAIKVPDGVDQMKYNMGTVEYMSLEIFQDVEFCPFRADVWAAGLSLYILLAGQMLSPTNLAGVMTIINGNYNKNVITDLLGLDLVEKILVPESQRPTSSEVLDHPWFK